MTKTTNTILYILNDADVNEATLKPALMYAKEINAHINFLRIFDSYKSMSTFFHIPSTELREKLLSNLESSIDKFKHLFQNIKYSCHVREGLWFVEAIHEAARVKADITIISEPLSHQVTFSSNAMHLVRKSPSPVWLIRRNYTQGSKKILVAVDIDLNDKIKKDVNTKCMNLAWQVASSNDQPCEIITVHCWSLANEKYLREIASNISSHQVDEMLNRERSFHEEWYHAFCKNYQDFNLHHAYFIKGDPEEEIPSLVRDDGIDLLIMGTVNSIITSGLYISSRAETIINNSTSASLLTVKPDGFVSPIQ